MLESPVTEREMAAFFDRQDCAGLGTRVVAGCIDLVVAAVIWIVAAVVTTAIAGPDEQPRAAVVAMCFFAVWFVYFVLLRYFGSTTVGYLVCRIRIVSMSGGRPSLWMLALRSFMGVLGPLPFLFDCGYCSEDPQRQTLKDKATRTYVVKRNARPVSDCAVVYANYTIFGLSIVVPECRPRG